MDKRFIRLQIVDALIDITIEHEPWLIEILNGAKTGGLLVTCVCSTIDSICIITHIWRYLQIPFTTTLSRCMDFAGGDNTCIGRMTYR